MKKIFNTFVAVALAVAASMSLSACGGDDDEPDDPGKDKTVKEVTMTTSFYVNQGVMDTYDVVAKSSLGEELSFATTPVNVNVGSETVSMYKVELEGKSNALPFTSTMRVSFTIKDGYTVPEKSDFAFYTSVSGKIVYTDGSNDTFASKGEYLKNTGVMGSKIHDYTERINSIYGSISATFTRDGITLE